MLQVQCERQWFCRDLVPRQGGAELQEGGFGGEPGLAGVSHAERGIRLYVNRQTLTLVFIQTAGASSTTS